MLDDLKNKELWIQFLNNKIEKGHINKKEKEALEEFINNEKYLDIANNINTYEFSYPKKIEISKIGKAKKRIVYQYLENENNILKMISYRLYKYDYIFSNNLYSYRKSKGVKNAIYKLAKNKNINEMYVYKADISNYFNSINIPMLLEILKDVLFDDNDLYKFFEKILLNPYVISNGEIISEQKGIMGGVPISSFLANIYLMEMDKYFYDEEILYCRYADDIIVFSDDKDKLYDYVDKIKKYLEKYKLCINKDKENYYNPHDNFEFLGFSFNDGIIDLSLNTIKKIKGKIKRSARGIRRWMLKKNAKEDYALKAMNRKFNRKFYNCKDKNDLNWSRWFFPVINTSKSLKIIDSYMQENLRYIVTGKYNKKNFEKVSYKRLKDCNYRPLVHEYYKYKNLQKN